MNSARAKPVAAATLWRRLLSTEPEAEPQLRREDGLSAALQPEAAASGRVVATLGFRPARPVLGESSRRTLGNSCCATSRSTCGMCRSGCLIRLIPNCQFRMEPSRNQPRNSIESVGRSWRAAAPSTPVGRYGARRLALELKPPSCAYRPAACALCSAVPCLERSGCAWRGVWRHKSRRWVGNRR